MARHGGRRQRGGSLLPAGPHPQTIHAGRMQPADHAAAILAWFADRPLAAVQADPSAAALLAHAEAIADAADADDEALRSQGLKALFAGLVEPLNDGFSPAGRAVYAQVFPRIIMRIAEREPALRQGLAAFAIHSESDLRARYASARRGDHPAPATAQRIAVLSRVTIGADILLTSVALQRLHQRYPQAELCVIGDGKLAPLLSGLPNVSVRATPYVRRGPLRERLTAWLTVCAAVTDCDLVVAPDSRLDQLGILPVTSDPARYHLWENTLPEGMPPRSLAEVLDDWLSQRFAPVWGRRCVPRLGLDAATHALATHWQTAFAGRPVCAVKLDHGGNSAKALPRSQEVAVLRALLERGWTILLDRGFGAEELANSQALLTDAGLTAYDIDDSGTGLGQPISSLSAATIAAHRVLRFHGSIAGWAAAVTACRHALSYDSVGHHLAAAAGIPVTVAFTGHTHAAFPVAWQPRGPGSIDVVVIPTEAKSVDALIQRLPDAASRA